MTVRYVLVAVNVSKALVNSLDQYVYMIDTTGYVGHQGEGGNELLTICKVKDTITWTVTSINPGNDVAILRITGAAVDSKMIQVTQPPAGGATSVSAYVSSAGTNVQYSIELDLEDGTHKSFDPYITALAASPGEDDE